MIPQVKPFLAVCLAATLQSCQPSTEPGPQAEEAVDSVDYVELIERWTPEVVDSDQPDALPLETLRLVGDRHAKAVWGELAVRGEPIQFVDASGRPVSYAFPYALEDPEIPDTAHLVEQSLRAHRASNSSTPASVHSGRYGTIFVSAHKTEYPVTQVLHSLHPYYYNAALALERTGDDAALVRLVSQPPHEFFEIQAQGKIVRLHTEILITDQEVFTAERTGARQKGGDQDRASAIAALQTDRSRRVGEAWNAYLSPHEPTPPAPPPPPPGFEFRIRRWQRMPAIDWTHWCEPTAAAMVFSFWDHYVPVPGIGTHVGYDRIVDYWFDNPFNNWNHNTPDIIEPIATGLNIDASNVLKGYNWTVDKVIGTPTNDYAWQELTQHLHLNRPFVWQVHPYSNDPTAPVGGPHATAAFGYRVVSGQKYVILYSTWSPDPMAALKEWRYDNWAHVEVDRYVPGGKELYRYLFIRRPRGGETFQVGQSNEILFAVHPQTDITQARIEYSLDGGQTWQLVAEMLTSPDWNQYWWTPPTTSDRARIRIKGMDASRSYLGGDGSFENFSIE